jgi:hypothetical protein
LYISRSAATVASLIAALAAWVSFGVIAPAAGARVGVLPTDVFHLTIVAAAAAAVLFIGLRSGNGVGTLVAVSPLALILLPWLPIRVPAAFLIWTGAIVSLIWCAVLIGLLRALVYGVHAGWLASGRSSAVVAGVASFVLFSVAAWSASPSIPGGDEPHYLVITQSLLYDHDLKIENNHKRGDYHAYFPGDLAPDAIRRGRNGEIYSIHAPGLPALVLPAFAIGGYHGAVIFLVAVASAACALAWWLAWRVTDSASAAWFGWAAVALCAPFVLETFTVYPDGVGAAIVLTGFWALVRAESESPPSPASRLRRDFGETRQQSPLAQGLAVWAAHGFALSLLPWLHTRFSVLAATLGGLILVRLARAPNAVGKAIAFLAAPALSALAWLFFFVVIYGTPDPSAPYGGSVQSSFAYLPNGLGGVLFDQGFGLFATAPVLAAGIIGFFWTRRLALDWAVMSVPYLLAVTTFAMWWAGWSGPARFVVPLVLPLAIPAACAWQRATHGWRVVMLTALLVSVWLSAAMAAGGGGRLGYHTRNEGGMTAAPWAEWANHAVDLASAMPAFVPLPIGSATAARVTAARTGFVALIPWLAALAVAAFAVAWFVNGRRHRAPERSVTFATFAIAIAVMGAASIDWTLSGAEPLTIAAAQMDALRALGNTRRIAIDVTHARVLRGEAATAMTIEIPIRRARRAPLPRPNRPLASFPDVPAGTYDVSVKMHGSLDGWVIVGVGNDQFAIATQPIADFQKGVRIALPAGARALSVRADEDARDRLEAIDLRPVSLASPPAAVLARHAVRYAASTVFFLDDRAFPEPAGFWVAGGRETAIVIAPDRPSGSAALQLRNAPVANTLALERGAWRQTIELGASEERRIDVPLDGGAGTPLRIRCSSGFRPSETDPHSRDSRLLGIYVRFSQESRR